MNCERYKPAKFEFITPKGVHKEKITKGVPQVDMSILSVSESFHAPPAYSLSNEMLVNYPPEDFPIPDTTPRFHHAFPSADVKPHNFVSKYQQIAYEEKPHRSVESVKHPGQRMLG